MLSKSSASGVTNTGKDVVANFSVASKSATDMPTPQSVQDILKWCLSDAEIAEWLEKSIDYQFVYFSNILTTKYRNESNVACQLSDLQQARESMKELTKKLSELQIALYGRG